MKRADYFVLVVALASGCFSLKPGTDVAADLAMNNNDDMPVAGDMSGDLAGDPCVDPTGFSGKGCYKSTPTTRVQLLNACTTAQCYAYDNTPLGISGGLPGLPTIDMAPPADLLPATDLIDPSPPDLLGADLSPPPDMATAPKLCSTLPGKVVYVTGSSAAGLFLGSIAQPLENSTTNPVTIVYLSQGSCIGVNAIATPSTNKMTGTAIYWDPSTSVDPTSAGAQLKCQLDAGGVAADVGLSDVFPSTCLNLPGGLDASINDFFGPVQTMNLVVPQNSSAMNISSEAAYLVYGFGAFANAVSPWLVPTQIYQRDANSGTEAMIAATIGVPRAHWYGKGFSGSGPMRDGLISAGGQGMTVASQTIGILSSDVLDAVRSNLRGLAFQDYNQNCGFFPDSTAMALDKANVRDGHYSHFGPLHMLAHVDGSKVPTSADAATVLNAITGVAPPPGVDIINLYAKHSLIPLCAMKVSRTADGGEISPFKPGSSCGCYYTERATGLVPPPGCTTCNVQQDCPSTAPNCNKFAAQTKGYCEP